MSLTETELSQLSRHVFHLKMPTNTGIIALPSEPGGTEIYIIDTGNNETTGKRILDFVGKTFRNAHIKAILNTHSHADHCGGNSYIAAQTGCGIWASKGEAVLLECPDIETQLIWGGTPIHDIRSQFLLAKPCTVTRVFDGEETIRLPCPPENTGNSSLSVRVISLPGHCVDQTGFLVTDTDGTRVMFAGDVLSGRNVIKNYWIQYLLDETKTKESLRKISLVEADAYIPGHGEATGDVESLAELNMLAILETENMILDELRSPKTMEDILKAVADRNGIQLRTSQFCLIGSTLRSYITGLYEAGKITFAIADNKMVWKRT